MASLTWGKNIFKNLSICLDKSSVHFPLEKDLHVTSGLQPESACSDGAQLHVWSHAKDFKPISAAGMSEHSLSKLCCLCHRCLLFVLIITCLSVNSLWTVRQLVSCVEMEASAINHPLQFLGLAQRALKMKTSSLGQRSPRGVHFCPSCHSPCLVLAGWPGEWGQALHVGDQDRSHSGREGQAGLAGGAEMNTSGRTLAGWCLYLHSLHCYLTTEEKEGADLRSWWYLYCLSRP